MDRASFFDEARVDSKGFANYLVFPLQLFGPASHAVDPRRSLSSILPELESAVQDLKAEVQRLEAEESHLFQNAKQTVGNLSDLRYGRLANGKLRDQIMEGLQNVQETSERKS